MKTKRIISMLLTTSLSLSAFPLTMAAAGSDAAKDSAIDDVIILDEGWSANGASLEFITDTDGDGLKNANGDNEYIHVDNSSPKSNQIAGGAYSDKVTLPAGKTYKFTVWLRSTPTYKNNAAADNVFSLFLGYQYGQNQLFKVGTNNKIKVLAVSEDVDSATGKITLSDTWTKYTSVFTTLEDVPFRSEGVIHGGIIFYADNPANGDGTPFDIDGLSLYESELTVDGYVPVSGAKNIVGGSIVDNWATHQQWNSRGAKLTNVSENPFHRAEAASADTALTYAPENDTVLDRGIYELSAKVRLGDFVWEEWIDAPAGGNAAALTATIGGATVTADSAVNVTNDWSTAKFTVEINADNVKLSDIKFAIDEARTLDIDDVKLRKLSSDDYLTLDGNFVKKVVESEAFDSYINAKDTDDNGKAAACVGYIGNALTSAVTNGDGGEFELSFYIRSNSATPDNVIVTLGSEFSSEFILSQASGVTGDDALGYITVNSIEGGAYSGTKLNLTTDWQKYTINFTIDGKVRNIAARGIRFHSIEDVDIGGLTLTRTDTNSVIIDENDGGEWYTDTIYCNSAAITDMACEYYTADAVNGIHSSSDEVITAGVYEVTGNFRTDAAAKLNAAANGQSSEAANIGTVWTAVKLTLDIKRDLQLSEINFVLDGAYDLDFANIKFTKKMEYDDSFVDFNDDPVAKIEEENPTAEYTSFARAADDNASNWYGFGYRGEALTTALTNGVGGTYELSFWARSSTENVDKFSLTLGTEYSSEYYLSKVGTTNTVTVNSVDGALSGEKNGDFQLSTDWQKYTVNFTLDGEPKSTLDTRGIRFHFLNNPVDIAELTLSRVDAGNEAAIIDGNEGGTWYTDNRYIDTAAIIPAYSTYFRAEDVAGIKPGSDEILPIGVYTVEGSFRSGSDTAITVSASDYTSDPINVTTSWTLGSTTLAVKKPISRSDIKFTLGGKQDLDFAGITFTKIMDYNTDYTDLDDNPVIKVDENNPFETYLSVERAADDNASNWYGFGYRGVALTTALTNGVGGTYELSFWARSSTENVDKFSLTLGTEYSSEYYLSKVGTTNTVTVNSVDGALSGEKNGDFQLSTDWQKYTVNFTLDGEPKSTLDTRGIRFHFLNNPVDIAELTLSRVDAGNEAAIIDGNEGGTWYTDNRYIDTAAIIPAYSTYFRAEDVAGIKPGSDEIVPMGIYEVKGTFRADADTILSVYANGEGSEGVEISGRWQEVTLTLRLKKSTARSDIEFTLGDQCTLDFNDITFTKVQDYELEAFIGANGDPIVKVNEEENPFETYVTVERAADDHTSAYYGFGYTSDALTKAINSGSGNTFELSFYIRSATEATDNIILTLGTEFSSEYILTKLGSSGDDSLGHIDVLSVEGGAYVNNRLALSTEWQKYTITFTLDGSVRNIAGKGVRFHNLNNPVDVGGLTLTNAETGAILVGENDDGKWYSDNLYVDSAAIGTEYSSYYRAEGTAGENTGFRINGTDELEPGVYYVTGEFRVGADDGSAQLSACLATAPLKTLSGADYVQLSDTWVRVTFVVDTVVDGFTIGDIMFMLDNGMNLDFNNITIEQIDRYVRLSSVNVGTIMALLALKKAYAEGRGPTKPDNGVRVELELSDMPVADREGNLLAATGNIRNWFYGDQSITMNKDEDGSTYLTMGNITNNKTGFRYAPQIAMRKGVYRFSGEFRAANEGETTVVRITIGGERRTLYLTNEWTKVEFIFVTDKKSAIEFTVKGGPVNWYVQDYDIRNLSLVDLSNDPIDIELCTTGDFENPENAMVGWSAPEGVGKIEVVTENGNSFLRNTERTVNYIGVYYTAPTEISEGVMYTVSYDIRTSVPGETTIARAHYYEGSKSSTSDLYLNDGSGVTYEATNEWKHIESTFVASTSGALRVGIAGGPYAEYIYAFDIDNFKITEHLGVVADEYTAGDFEDPNTALLNWSRPSGGGVMNIVTEDGNSFLRNTERTINYHELMLRTPVKVQAGNQVRVAYDARTSVPGETSVLRANIKAGDAAAEDLKLTSGASNNQGNEFTINNEWRHVECIWTATADGTLQFAIGGGGRVEYIQSFDLDNLVIEVIE